MSKVNGTKKGGKSTGVKVPHQEAPRVEEDRYETYPAVLGPLPQGQQPPAGFVVITVTAK